MIGLVHAEWIKWRSLRSSWVLWAAVVLTNTAFSLLFALNYSSKSTSASALRNVFDGFPPFLFILLAVIGALIITGEYSQNTAAPTFLAAPKRGRVVAAKFLFAVAIGVITAAIAGIAAFAVGAIALSARDIPYAVGADGIALQCFKSATYCALGVVFGFALGALLRQATMTVVLCVLFPTLITGIVGGFLPTWAQKALPTNAIDGLISAGGEASGSSTYPIGVGIAVFAAWMAVLLAIGMVLINRADTK
jgi:ABC-type transport system involved in multi-copper enzyme maturation permease subunit